LHPNDYADYSHDLHNVPDEKFWEVLRDIGDELDGFPDFEEVAWSGFFSQVQTEVESEAISRLITANKNNPGIYFSELLADVIQFAPFGNDTFGEQILEFAKSSNFWLDPNSLRKVLESFSNAQLKQHWETVLLDPQYETVFGAYQRHNESTQTYPTQADELSHLKLKFGIHDGSQGTPEFWELFEFLDTNDFGNRTELENLIDTELRFGSHPWRTTVLDKFFKGNPCGFSVLGADTVEDIILASVLKYFPRTDVVSHLTQTGGGGISPDAINLLCLAVTYPQMAPSPKKLVSFTSALIDMLETAQSGLPITQAPWQHNVPWEVMQYAVPGIMRYGFFADDFERERVLNLLLQLTPDFFDKASRSIIFDDLERDLNIGLAKTLDGFNNSNLKDTWLLNLAQLDDSEQDEDETLVGKDSYELKYPNIEDALKVYLDNCTDLHLLDSAAKSDNPFIGWCIGYNKNTPSEILTTLAHDPHSSPRAGVAQNPEAPVELLEHLANDQNLEVRWYVSLHEKTPQSVLQRLASDNDNYVADKATERLNSQN